MPRKKRVTQRIMALVSSDGLLLCDEYSSIAEHLFKWFRFRFNTYLLRLTHFIQRNWQRKKCGVFASAKVTCSDRTKSHRRIHVHASVKRGFHFNRRMVHETSLLYYTSEGLSTPLPHNSTISQTITLYSSLLLVARLVGLVLVSSLC